MAVVVAVLSATGAQGAAPSGSVRVGAVTFSRLVEKLPAGREWLILQEGPLCVSRQKLKADGGQIPVSLELYAPIFAREMTAAGVGKEEATNLFAEAATGPDAPSYEIGGLVQDIQLKVCARPEHILGPRIRGSSVIQVQWQIYSPAKRAVVATIETAGSYTLKNTGYVDAAAASLGILQDAFADAARKLAASPEFRTLLSAPPPTDELRSTPGQQTKIVAAVGQPVQRPIADTVGSVVAIVLPDGHGSGVLISNDGHVLTNAHVVGERQTVKVRWSDGFEAEGQVLRVHKDRDVALVKTDPHGRLPLSVRAGAVQPGDTVMAIGAPLDLQWQGTVTRGIVSNVDRIFKGYRFIQSDVMVNPGNSGGALIDDKGYLVGLTDLGFRPDGAPAGLNYFIPIKDALDFVSLDLVAPSEPAVQKAAAR